MTTNTGPGPRPLGMGARFFNTITDPAAPPEDVVIPDTPAGLEEMLGDGKRMTALFAQPEGFKNFVQSYARVVLDKDQSIATQVKEQTQQILNAWLKERRDEEGAVPASPLNFGNASGLLDPGGSERAAQKAGLYNARAMGAPLDKEFTGPHAAADYFNLIWRDHKRNVDAAGQAKLSRIRAALSSNVPSDGGFLIPENLRSELLRVSLETAVVRSRARVIPMDSLRVPFPMIDATSDASSVFGGIVGYWTEEGATLTASQPAFGRLVLDAKKLTAYTEVPQELVADSIISFQPFISQIFPEALAFYEDIAFIKGTGVGEPFGGLSTANPATIAVAAEGGQPTATIVWENIVKMFARMLPSSLGRAVWVATIDAFPELATMALSVGTGGSAIWLNNGVEGPPMTILGRPVIFTEKAPAALGTRGDISFVDWGYYLIGDRQAMSASASEHYKFGNDLVAYKIVERVDGRPWLQSAITPQNSGPTLSPFVQLATRP